MERIVAQNSSVMESEYFFPKRSQINTTGKKLELAANYFRFEFLNKNQRTFYKYAVQFEPELPGDSRRLRSKVFNQARDPLKNYLGHCIFNNTTVYSLENFPDKIEVLVESNSQSYKISVSLTNMIEADDFEAESLYKKFFSCLVRKIKFIQIRKNFFNSQCAKILTNHQKLEVWPGFNSSVNIMQEGTLLNMNLVYRVVRPETALDKIKIFSANNHLNSEDLANSLEEQFKGVAVLTRYNNDKVYILDGIDMMKSPKDKFDTKNGPVSYLEYYKSKYGYKIQNSDQPLLIHRDKRTGMEIRLIPELCYLTGLTDDMRANFNLMKELSVITKGNAQEKLKECRDLINNFNSNNECQQEMQNWGLTINNTPLTLCGARIQAGNYLMHKTKDGNRYSFAIDDAPDVDRKIQAEMFTQPALNTWAIFATMKDESLANQFVETMKQVQGTFNYQMKPPAVFLIKSQNYRDWEAEISRNLQNNKINVQAVVLIIPGSRGKGQLYNDLKRLMMGTFPIPSQVVLSGTLAKGKGIRSIVNKILIQICAKIGGEPWAVDSLPFTNCPTMVCGIDIYKGAGKSILGFTATYNRTFTRYVSLAKVIDESKPLSAFNECLNEAIQNFSLTNKISPQHIIIIRDGVAPTQMHSVCVPEAKAAREIIQDLKLGCKLTYTLLNKKTNLKVFLNDRNSILNAPPGTIIDTKVTSSEFNDFYLIPAKSTQGVASSIHYQIIFDDAKVQERDFHSLVYKLSYLYFNWTGSIKVPAPCQYARKLVTLLGEKLSDKRSIYLPDPRFAQQLKSLYYL